MAMKDTVELIAKYAGANYALAAGIAILAYSMVIALVRLLEIWRALRTRKAILEECKLQAEVLKLRSEIEALRKQSGLEPLSQSIEWLGPQSTWAFPSIPEFSLRILRNHILPSTKAPPVGLPRALWSLKCLVLIIVLVWFMVVASVKVLPEELATVLVGIVALPSIFLAPYFLLRALYHFGLAIAAAYIVKKESRANAAI